MKLYDKLEFTHLVFICVLWYNTFIFFGGERVLLFILAAVLTVFGLWLRFGLMGYRFSALICFALAGLLACCGVFRLLPHPIGSILLAVVNGCVALGILVVGITEIIILRTAFKAPTQECSHIIVLGCLVRSDGPSRALSDRIRAAAHYLKAHPNTVAIVSGGRGIDEPRTEAGCMCEQLLGFGIEPHRILVEDKATSTWENLRFSLALLPQAPKRLGILSSDYHLFRARLLARRQGLDPIMIPARTTSIPHAIDHFLREAAGVWHNILLGGHYDQ